MSEPTPTNETPAQEPQGSQAPASGQGEQPTQNNEPTLTQAEVNKLIGKTRQEARDSAKKAILEDLGLEDIDSLKSVLAEAQKRKEAEMSELERAQAQIEAANKAKMEANARYEALEAKMIANARQQAFIKAANANGGQDVDNLFILVQAKHGEDFKSVFGDDGIPDDKKMEAFLKQVQSAFPTYFGTASAGSPSNANGFAPSSQTELDRQTQQKLAKRFGRL